MSLSKIFKAPQLQEVGEVKVIRPIIPAVCAEAHGNPDGPQGHDSLNPAGDQAEVLQQQQIQQEIEALMQEARIQAQTIIAGAEEQARQMAANAERQIDQWWQENQQKLDELSMEAKQQGYEEGFQRGNEEGLQFAQQDYEGRIEQAAQLLTQAYEQKQVIISEAEPFLLELSLAIAEQIMKQELASYPDKFLQLIGQHILRFKEKDSITICVNTEDFAFVQSHRDKLQAVVSGDTEVKVIPDHSVSAYGCMIRTAYGSVDARLDTQLNEIKKVLFEVGKEPADAVGG